MMDTRNNFRFVEVVNNDDRENYTKLVLKKVYTLPVDKDGGGNGPRKISSKVEEMRKNFEPSNGFSYLRPSLFTPKPFSSSTGNLHHNTNNNNYKNMNEHNQSLNYKTQVNSNDPIYANKPLSVPRPAVPPKPRYKKPPPLPLIDNDRPKCASPLPELPLESPQEETEEDPNSFLNNLKNIKNLRQTNPKSTSRSLIFPCNNNNNNNNTFANANIKHQSCIENNRRSNSNNDLQHVLNTKCSPTSSSSLSSPSEEVNNMNGNRNASSPKMKSPISNNNNLQSVIKSPQYKELFEQKSQIRDRLFSKIEVLREEERELANEKVEIDFLTRRFYVRLLDKNESDADKFSQFIQEIQQITKLKSGLILRLDKLENGGHLKYTPEEIMKKRAQLQGQILEAENLQKNTDRRRKVQDRIIQNHFSNEDFLEFQGMINSLTRIVRDQREMEHKITMGNEKLRALDDIE